MRLKKCNHIITHIFLILVNYGIFNDFCHEGNALIMPIMSNENISSLNFEYAIYPKDILRTDLIGNNEEWNRIMKVFCDISRRDTSACEMLYNDPETRIKYFQSDFSKFSYINYTVIFKSHINSSLKCFANYGRGSYGSPSRLFWWGNGNFSFENPCLVVGRYCSLADNITVILDFNKMESSLLRCRISMYPWHMRYKQIYNDRNFVIKRKVRDLNTKKPSCSFNYRPIIIGNDVWIGMNVVLMPGVTVGDGAVVGAHSVVWHNVEPYSIVIGNPAVRVGYRFQPDVISELLQIKWWEWSDEKIDAMMDLFESDNVTSLFLSRGKEKG